MTTGLSATVANDITGALVNAGTYTGPSALWVKLHTGDPGAAGTSNPATNTTREQATFGTPSGGVAATTGDVTWSVVPASETYSYVSVWDASSGGNFVGSAELAAAISVTSGQSFDIPAGNLAVNLTQVAA